MEDSPTYQEHPCGAHENPYVFSLVVLETDDPLALFLRAKGWVEMELGCMFQSYYCTVTVEEIEVTSRFHSPGSYQHTRTRKCLRLREISVA